MPPRASLLLLSLTVAACTAAEPPPPPSTRAPSARTRWVRPRSPQALSLLEAPARVVARTPSRASLEVASPSRVLAVRVGPGDVVEAGQPLVEVASPELVRAAAAVGSAEARLGPARARRDRLRGLEGEGLARSAERFEADARVAELEAVRDEAWATLRAAGLAEPELSGLARTGRRSLRAPAGGVVTEVDAPLGAIVDSGHGPLVTIVGARPARVEARLSGRLPREVEVELVAFDGRRVPLRPEPEAEVVDAASGGRLVWFAPIEDVPLPDGLLGRLHLRPAGEAFEVPASALVHADGETRVWTRRGTADPIAVPVERLAGNDTVALVRGPLGTEPRPPGSDSPLRATPGEELRVAEDGELVTP
jgi:multidrug efflux pump subunit AcrA (membrane-fusion protein)